MKPKLRISAILFTAMALSASPAFAATVYTGDSVDGKKVISQLDLKDLEPGKIHKFLFEGVEMGTGQHWYVPVMVAKGAKPGKRLLLEAEAAAERERQRREAAAVAERERLRAEAA